MYDLGDGLTIHLGALHNVLLPRPVKRLPLLATCGRRKRRNRSYNRLVGKGRLARLPDPQLWSAPPLKGRIRAK